MVEKNIAAASIIAKVTRDRIMRELHTLYPLYGILQHKGYGMSHLRLFVNTGVAHHMRMIALYGPSPIHRKSFEPVKSMLKTAHPSNAPDSNVDTKPPSRPKRTKGQNIVTI